MVTQQSLWVEHVLLFTFISPEYRSKRFLCHHRYGNEMVFSSTWLSIVLFDSWTYIECFVWKKIEVFNLANSFVYFAFIFSLSTFVWYVCYQVFIQIKECLETQFEIAISIHQLFRVNKEKPTSHLQSYVLRVHTYVYVYIPLLMYIVHPSFLFPICLLLSMKIDVFTDFDTC